MTLSASSRYDYRTTHTAPAKGMSYEQKFADVPWRAYVWQRERLVLDEVLRRYFADRPVRHLDFACGTGRILGHLADRARLSVGVDVSESMLAVARQRPGDAEWIRADITRDDVLARRTFNLITAFRFFPNAQPELRAEALRALARHLTPDGVLLLNNHKNHSSLLCRLARLVGKRPRTMSARDVTELASSVGLVVARTFAIGVLPATDKHMLVPRWCHRLVDRAANALGIAPVLAQNVIYVCRRGKSQSPRAKPSRDVTR